ncbi:MAG: M12 family metallo-peptidase [Bdellovibrionota bacterium]
MALTAVALTSGCGFAPGSDDSPVDAIFADASSEAEADAQANDPSEAARRRRYVRVNARALARAIGAAESGSTRVFKLNLFEGEPITVVLEDVMRITDDNVTATGRIVGDSESAVTLVMNKDVLLVNVRRGTSDEQFEVRYVGDGLHKVRELLPDHGDEGCETANSPGATAMSEEESLAESIASNEDDASPLATPVIDILAAYTPAARTKMGGIDAVTALIQLGIADTNRALADSGVALAARLVGIVALTQNETGNWSSDLSALRSKTDGKWNAVHTERTRLGADQVSLVVSSPSGSVAGIGYVNASASTAFTITRTSAFKAYSFSHELGHNLGLNHTDGYVSSAGRFRTIIAYGTYPRARRYSNPNLTYLGYKTGDSSHNESSILNRNAYRVSSLISSLVR